ncbi:MAG TPA: hypothetical protein VFQ38_05580 [Longimicrobiales bacterium]|nr:hypothetical protein [Longimicrobiales bacterium]
MRKMLKRLFGKRETPVPAGTPLLDEELIKLEREASTADDFHRAQLFNRAGDLCAQDRERVRAMSYYGRAIDAYLVADHYDAAVAMCRKIIRFEPTVVRAHCTLALLAVGNRFLGDAEREIDAYVAAASRSRTEHLAIPRLRLMAEAAGSGRVRRRVADHLHALGDDAGAEQVLLTLGDVPEVGDPIACDGEQWQRLVRVALTDTVPLWGEAGPAAPTHGSPGGGAPHVIPTPSVA